MTQSISDNILIELDRANDINEDTAMVDWALPPSEMFKLERKHNFTPLERYAFLGILKKYANIVESKSSDASTYFKKSEAWAKITQQFNAHPHTIQPALTKQLKRLWSNLKQKQRRERIKQPRPAAGRKIKREIDEINNIEAKIASKVVKIQEAVDSDPLIIPDIKEEKDLELSEKPPSSPFTDSSESITFTNLLAPTVTPTVTQQPQSTNVSNTSITETTGNTVSLHSVNLPNNTPVFASSQPKSHPSLSNTLNPPNPKPLFKNIQNVDSNHATRPTRPQILINRQKGNILEREYNEKRERLDQLHQLQMQLLKEQVREAKIKADLAELMYLQRKGGWN